MAMGVTQLNSESFEEVLDVQNMDVAVIESAIISQNSRKPDTSKSDPTIIKPGTILGTDKSRPNTLREWGYDLSEANKTDSTDRSSEANQVIIALGQSHVVPLSDKDSNYARGNDFWISYKAGDILAFSDFSGTGLDLQFAYAATWAEIMPEGVLLEQVNVSDGSGGYRDQQALVLKKGHLKDVSDLSYPPTSEFSSYAINLANSVKHLLRKRGITIQDEDPLDLGGVV